MGKFFRTELNLQPSAIQVSHSTPIFTIGSCFADTIGKLLQGNKFTASVNLLGTLYSPPSVHKALEYVVYNEMPLASGYIENEGIWSNYDFHSSLSAPTKRDLEKKISDVIGSSHDFLKDAELLILTYGTARVFHRSDSGEPVANCHTISGEHFTVRLLTPETIEASFGQLYETLKRWRPALRILLTVSPVRHTKDTLELNSVSKSILRLTCHRLQEHFEDVEYFPAYELMMDDLRDYRFYEPDMIHPSGEAIDYIWEKFSDRYFNSQTRKIMKEWQEVSAALHHRAFHPESERHQRFLRQTLRELEELKAVIRVEEEIKRVKAQLR